MTDSTLQAIETARDYAWGRRSVDAREHADSFASAIVELAGGRPYWRQRSKLPRAEVRR